MDRTQHLQWAKDRAAAYLDKYELENAHSSFVSDMGKHEELHLTITPLMAIGMDCLMRQDPIGLRQWINGFN